MKPLLKLAVLALLVSAACSSCASKSTRALNPARRKVDKGVAVFTPSGFGRGCPVSGFIMTARHVVQKPRFDGYYDAWWSDSFGNDGSAALHSTSNAVDAAALLPDGPMYPVQVTIGKPTVGEEVYWFDYDYKDTRMTTRLRRAKLLRRVGGHLILSESATSGASGGCIFNRKGEAIGIMVWVLRGDIGIGLQFPKEWS